MRRKKKVYVKNLAHERRSFRHRMITACIGMVILTALLITRLAYLQIQQHALYTTLSEKNQLDITPIAPDRGLIFDRNGVLLAKNTPVFSLELVPAKIENLNKTIQQLRHILPVTTSELENFHKQLHQHRHFESIPLRLRLNEKEVASFMARRYQFPGVTIRAHLIRQYPFPKAFSHVVGYVGRINEKELARVDTANYSATNYIGKTGIEHYYEDRLHGIVGYQQAEVDASGRVIRVIHRVSPIAGANLTLTLDSHLQEVAEKALGERQGAVVAIDPNNGEILAMVSTPSFDANQFVSGLSQKTYDKLVHEPDQPLFNRDIRGQYPPASTIKPFLAIEGLISGKITPEFKVYDNGTYQLKISNHVYHDWKRYGHGWVNLIKAIMVSCDTYFYELARRLGIDNIANISHAFGFGKKTGVDLPAELSGLVPTQAWKKRAHNAPWYPGDTLVAGIGQGYMLTTPLQLASATAKFSMHGDGFQPHLLHISTLANGRQHAFQPIPQTHVDLPKAYWNLVVEGMRDVITNPQGTGFKFGRNVPYTVAAKTGTGQVYNTNKYNVYTVANLPYKLRNHSLFIAFAPIEHPKIAIAVIVEHSDIHVEHSTSASHIARLVMDAYLLKGST
ncbi:MAG: penicillin-binding protein [marine bacterium B5-7]|nr:MAG: penicillin-binding protein [marine bacterium B5-7]